MAIDPEWVLKLTPLMERDHFIREALVKRGTLNDTYHPEMEKVHLENARKLNDIILKKGFPVISNAGEQGVRLAWNIIHNSISSPDFMRSCLTEMRLAAASGDFPRDLLASTEDRIAFFEGRGQLYGTSFDWDQGELRATLIEDPEFLDQRRASVGLPPQGEVQFRISDSPPPKDPEKKNIEFNNWLKRVGWRL